MTDDPLKPAGDAVSDRFVTPRHGHGRLRPWRPGQSGNPGGIAGRYGEVVRLAREASPEIIRQLIAIASDPSEDARVRIVAGQEILNRAWGKPKEMEPEAAAPAIELAGASEEQLRLVLATVIAAQKVIDGGGDGD